MEKKDVIQDVYRGNKGNLIGTNGVSKERLHASLENLGQDFISHIKQIDGPPIP